MPLSTSRLLVKSEAMNSVVLDLWIKYKYQGFYFLPKYYTLFTGVSGKEQSSLSKVMFLKDSFISRLGLIINEILIWTHSHNELKLYPL